MPIARTLPLVLLPALLLAALATPAAAEVPAFDASCLDDPRSCLQGAAGERTVAAPEASTEPPLAETRGLEAGEEPLVLTLDHARPPESESATPPGGALAASPLPLDRAGCVETSVRAGNGLAESQRVCAAVFPEPGAGSGPGD